MVLPHGRPADGVVKGKRKIQDGPPARSCADRGPERCAQMSDCRVVRDGGPVVEKQRNGKGTAIGRDNCGCEYSPKGKCRPIREPHP